MTGRARAPGARPGPPKAGAAPGLSEIHEHMELMTLFERTADYSPGQDSLSGLPTSGGVYLLTDANDRPIQLACTADLKRALRHRLTSSVLHASETGGPDTGQTGRAETTATECVIDAAAADAGSAPGPAPLETAGGPARRRQLNLGEIVRRIWWKPAHSPFELTFLYYEIARALMPNAYRKQLAFAPAWFVHVDPSAALPQFTAGRFLRSPPGTDLGPFATQADAARFVEILQDTFDLCRYHHILEQAPHGQACAYFEMGRCPAPCDGTISLDRYRGMIADACRFACGQRHDAYRRINFAMRAAAANRRYEQAGALKKQLERARGIEHAAFARAAPIETLTFLVLQRGAGTTGIKPFLVRRGIILAGQPVKRSGVRGALERWRCELSAGSEPLTTEQRSEHVWLVSHFLFKPDPPGLFLRLEELADEAAVLERVDARFAPRRRPATGSQGGSELKDPVESNEGRAE